MLVWVQIPPLARGSGSFDPSLLFPTPLAIFGEVFYVRTAEVGDSGLAPIMKSKFTQQSLPIHRRSLLFLDIQYDIKTGKLLDDSLLSRSDSHKDFTRTFYVLG